MLAPDRVAVGVPDWARAQALGSALGVSPVLAALMIGRGVTDAAHGRAYLESGLETCHDPFLMRDMPAAVELLEEALARQEPISVHGDYDVDGVSATVLLVQGLRRLGGEVRYHVPHRVGEGYGLSPAAVEQAAADGARLLLTCDCGSSSLQAVETARRCGMRVILSDHHQLPEVLPVPDAFLNPNLPDCPYPEKNLCGTGVAWKLLVALHQRRGLPLPLESLDLVALATIADVVPLQGENRALVQAGLQALARLERPGLAALVAQCRLDQTALSAQSVAFSLAPRLNAAGRLDSADLAVELLLDQDPERCLVRAGELDELNTRRQEVEQSIRQAIVDLLEREPSKLERGVLVEAGEGWHHGVLGITAARLVEQFERPVFVATLEGELARGSARAPLGMDLFAAMSRCSEVFVKFGGHARAAGFTVEASRLDEMRECLTEAVVDLRQKALPRTVDFELPLKQVGMPLVRELQRLEPLGEGNRRPLFLAREVHFEKVRQVGHEGAHASFLACQGEVCLKGIAFRQGAHAEEMASGDLSFDVLYTVEEDTWNGESRPQLVIEAILQPDPVVLEVLGVTAGPGIETSLPRTGPALVDSRRVRNRLRYLQALRSRSDSLLLVAAGPRQAEKVRQHLNDSALQVACFEELPSGPGPQEVLLLAPPPRLEVFDHPPLSSAHRIHLLFGCEQMERQRQRVRVLYLDRERMVRIWKALVRRVASGALAESELEKVAREVDQGTHPITLRQAIRILEELDLARWELSGDQRWLSLGTGSGRRLEDSQRFTALNHLRREFLQVQRAFGRLQIGLICAGAGNG
ncbi:MAG: single-stranded-DNA-specific exonuclease RecJ [Candidatus Xenobium sp.]|jgi:single-stranded-DNA-specific exonuclease